MEEIVAIATPPVGRTNPDGIAYLGAGIGPPQHVVISRKAELQWQLDVPAAVRVRVRWIGETFGRKKILVIGRIQLGGQAPLF